MPNNPKRINPKTWEILAKCQQNSIEFSQNSGNSGQNVQYFSQMATLIVAFPKYLGYSSQIRNHVTFSKIYVMAFTSCDAKIFVVVNLLHERALPNVFCSQMFIIYFIYHIFDSNSSQFCFLLHKFPHILCFVGIQK